MTRKSKRGRGRWWLLAAVVVVLLVVAAPRLVGAYWQWRSSNPVRRGVTRATELGCFSCHGPQGKGGIADPGEPQGVPGWSGGVWMMYVENDDEIRKFIVQGSVPEQGMAMPAYGDVLGGSDLDDLVAAFKVLSAMNLPDAGSAARHGYELARDWDCLSCHGPGASGGLPNPGSFAGFIPGWYGADFEDLVRDRDEFDEWVKEGVSARMADHPIASFFVRRQRVAMPAYPALTKAELDDLWAYAGWLGDTGGGVD